MRYARQRFVERASIAAHGGVDVMSVHRWDDYVLSETTINVGSDRASVSTKVLLALSAVMARPARRVVRLDGDAATDGRCRNTVPYGVDDTGHLMAHHYGQRRFNADRAVVGTSISIVPDWPRSRFTSARMMSVKIISFRSSTDHRESRTPRALAAQRCEFDPQWTSTRATFVLLGPCCGPLRRAQSCTPYRPSRTP